MLLHSDSLLRFLADPFLLLFLNAVYATEKHICQFYSLNLTEARTHDLQHSASILTITPAVMERNSDG